MTSTAFTPMFVVFARQFPDDGGGNYGAAQGHQFMTVQAPTLGDVRAAGIGAGALEWLRGISVRQVRLACGLIMFAYPSRTSLITRPATSPTR
jgi:hypothetical protein